MSAPRANQRTVEVHTEYTAAYLNLVRGWPLLHASRDPFGRMTFYFAADAQADADAWYAICDRFRAEQERAERAQPAASAASR